MKDDYIRFGKFLIVGVLNTVISYCAYILLRLFEIDSYICNVLSYIVGVTNSFLWNKLWVFQSKHTNVKKEILAFVIVFLVCYTCQLLLFSFLLESLLWNEYLAQFCGMCLYTILNFFLNRMITFKKIDKNDGLFRERYQER